MGYKKSAEDKNCVYPCKKCGKIATKGQDFYIQKNSDDSWTSCIDLECYKSQGGTIDEKKSFGGRPFSSSKFPVSDVTNILKLSFECYDAFEKKYSIQGEKIPFETKLQGVESFFKTISGGFKP